MFGCYGAIRLYNYYYNIGVSISVSTSASLFSFPMANCHTASLCMARWSARPCTHCRRPPLRHCDASPRDPLGLCRCPARVWLRRCHIPYRRQRERFLPCSRWHRLFHGEGSQVSYRQAPRRSPSLAGAQNAISTKIYNNPYILYKPPWKVSRFIKATLLLHCQ